MAGSKRIGILYLVLIALFISQCKNHEAVRTNSPKTDLSPCAELARNTPEDALLFVGEAESKSKQVAAKKAQKKTVIELVQFFQSEFIESGQIDLFRDAKRLGNQHSYSPGLRAENEEFRKKWAETSYEMIGIRHNQKAFTHHQKILEDSTGFIAYNLLAVSDDWVRNHWKESLAATDSSYFQNVMDSKFGQEIKEMDIHRRTPCRSFNPDV